MVTPQSLFAERVGSAIRHNPYLAGRTLRFEAEEGHVVLKGVVNTFFQKQMAQEALRHIEGVATIDNHLEVDWLNDNDADSNLRDEELIST